MISTTESLFESINDIFAFLDYTKNQKLQKQFLPGNSKIIVFLKDLAGTDFFLFFNFNFKFKKYFQNAISHHNL